MAPSTAHVISVRGPVLDLRIDGALPAIHEAVEIDSGDSIVMTEVQAHLDEQRVRVIALQSTEGIARGTPARLTGAALKVPVGQAVLGRLLDVMGRTGDQRADLPADTPRRPIHRESPTLA